LTEDHGTDVYGPFHWPCPGDLEFFAVIDGSLPHPGAEDRLDGQSSTGPLDPPGKGEPVFLLAIARYSLQRSFKASAVEIRVVGRPGFLLHPVEGVLKFLLVDSEGDLPKELNEPPVSVVGETSRPR